MVRASNLGNGVDHDRDEHLTLPRGQLGVARAAQRGEQVPPLGLSRGVETEPVRQLVPVLGVQWHTRVLPEVPPDLVRDLEDDELVRPCGEPAFAPELAELAGDGNQGVRRGLLGQVFQLGTGDPQPRAAPPALPLRDTQQHLVQPG